MALPGIAAATIFTFVMSWNEVLGAAILTLNHRTLPAQVLSSLRDSPLAYRFAGGFVLVLPALVFIFFMRKLPHQHVGVDDPVTIETGSQRG